MKNAKLTATTYAVKKRHRHPLITRKAKYPEVQVVLPASSPSTFSQASSTVAGKL